jgi:hypothetical protein
MLVIPNQFTLTKSIAPEPIERGVRKEELDSVVHPWVDQERELILRVKNCFQLSIYPIYRLEILLVSPLSLTKNYHWRSSLDDALRVSVLRDSLTRSYDLFSKP